METFPPNSVGGSPPTSPPPLNLDHFSSSRDFTKVALSGSGCQTGVPLIPPPIQATPPHPFLFFEGGGVSGWPPHPHEGREGGCPPPRLPKISCGFAWDLRRGACFPAGVRQGGWGDPPHRQVAPLHPLFIFWRWGGPPLPPLPIRQFETPLPHPGGQWFVWSEPWPQGRVNFEKNLQGFFEGVIV